MVLSSLCEALGSISALKEKKEKEIGRLSAVALIYLFRINGQLLVVSLEVATAVSSLQTGDQLSLAGVGSRSPRNRGISRAPL